VYRSFLLLINRISRRTLYLKRWNGDQEEHHAASTGFLASTSWSAAVRRETDRQTNFTLFYREMLFVNLIGSICFYQPYY
jgi:hypothetical protein